MRGTIWDKESGTDMVRDTVWSERLDTAVAWHFQSFEDCSSAPLKGKGLLITPLYDADHRPYFLIEEDEDGVGITGEAWIVPETAAVEQGQRLTKDIAGSIAYRLAN